MLNLFRKWFTPGVTLEPEDLRASIRLVVRIAIILFLAVLLLGTWVVLTTHRPTAVADQAPDAMVRMVTAVGVWGVICLAAYASIQAWDNSSRASNLLHIQAGDSPSAILAKILGAVMMDAAIVLAAAIVFGRVVGL